MELQNCSNWSYVGLSGPFSPKPGSKQVCLEQAAQAQVNVESLQGQRYHNLSINPIPVFDHSHGKQKNLNNWSEYSTLIYFLTQNFKIYDWFKIVLIAKKLTCYSLLCASKLSNAKFDLNLFSYRSNTWHSIKPHAILFWSSGWLGVTQKTEIRYSTYLHLKAHFQFWVIPI